MDNTGDQQIVPGVSVTTGGLASVDPSLTDVLFDLAIKLETTTGRPVDVEHVVAAIVLAARMGHLDPNTPLMDEPELVKLLTSHVESIFEQFGGKVGGDD